jgi:hypothetical protein
MRELFGVPYVRRRRCLRFKYRARSGFRVSGFRGVIRCQAETAVPNLITRSLWLLNLRILYLSLEFASFI